VNQNEESFMPTLPATRRPLLPSHWQARVARWRWLWGSRRYALLKRGMDLTLVVPALLLLLPLFALVAWAIRRHDGGPVLFWQRRVGLNGREFAFPKFRSMCVNAEAKRSQIEQLNQHGQQGVTFKLRADPRITPVGRWIRRTSVDELPQLWCVLRGEMSLVGPRPALVSEVARYTQTERERLSVLPGLTCFWQVQGRAEIPFDQQVELDLRYIRQRSLWLDGCLLLATVPAVVGGRGAY